MRARALAIVLLLAGCGVPTREPSCDFAVPVTERLGGSAGDLGVPADAKETCP